MESSPSSIPPTNRERPATGETPDRSTRRCGVWSAGRLLHGSLIELSCTPSDAAFLGIPAGTGDGDTHSDMPSLPPSKASPRMLARPMETSTPIKQRRGSPLPSISYTQSSPAPAQILAWSIEDTAPCPACGAPCMPGESCSDTCINKTFLDGLLASLSATEVSDIDVSELHDTFLQAAGMSAQILPDMLDALTQIDDFPNVAFDLLELCMECVNEAITTWRAWHVRLNPAPVHLLPPRAAADEGLAVDAVLAAAPLGLQDYIIAEDIVIYSNLKTSHLVLSSAMEGALASPFDIADFVARWHLQAKGPVKVYRKLNFLEFKIAEDASTSSLWLEIMRSSGFPSKVFGLTIVKAARGHFLAALYKGEDQSYFSMPSGVVQRYIVPIRKTARVAIDAQEVLEALLETGLDVVTNIAKDTVVAALVSPQDVLANCLQRSAKELLLDRMAAEMTLKKDKTAHQRALCAGWGAIQKLMELERAGPPAAGGMIVPVLNCPFHIFGKDDFEGLDQIIGERHDELTGETLKLSLWAYIMDPNEHETHACVVMGGNNTTGWGKSAVVEKMCSTLATVYAARQSQPLEDAYFIRASSLEGVKQVQDKVQPGVPLMLDEFEPSDTDQIQYLSANGLKCLLDVSRACDLRGRGQQLLLPAQTPRIFTANSNSLKDWVGSRFSASLPMWRKCWHFVITKRILKVSAVEALKRQNAESSSVKDHAALMKEHF